MSGLPLSDAGDEFRCDAAGTVGELTVGLLLGLLVGLELGVFVASGRNDDVSVLLRLIVMGLLVLLMMRCATGESRVSLSFVTKKFKKILKSVTYFSLYQRNRMVFRYHCQSAICVQGRSGRGSGRWRRRWASV